MRLLITTLGRLENQVTLENLTKGGLRDLVTLVVQDQEYAGHKARYADVQIMRLPTTIRTLGPTRRYLCTQLKQKIVLLDDDLHFYCRNDPDDWHLKYSTPEQLRLMFEEVEDKLEDYAHVSVSAREGNNTVSEYWRENGRYMRLLGYNPKLFPSGLQIGRVDGMSDFDLNLQLLRRGAKSIVCYRHAQGHPGTQTPGGCSLNRTKATHEEEIRRMLEWHCGFVKLRLKKNKGGGEFGTRQELTIYWKKAYESCQKKKTPG
jgi:hypothetical protein